MPLQIGQVLNHRYRIDRFLKAGGFGTVYYAWDINLNTACAVKENLDNSSDAQRQFTREASLLSQLSHPNLPRVTDHFILPGLGQYLVMDYIEGDDLEAMRCSAGGALLEASILPWIMQVCDALIYLHSRNPPIIHRDIKPANIRITSQGKAVLVDFGIAKQASSGPTTIGAKAITPGYSPPEQYTGTGTDERSDVYALGATIYTLLTGHELPESIQRLMGSSGTRPPHLLRPGISSPVSLAIMRAINPDQTKRLASVHELKAALSGQQTPLRRHALPCALVGGLLLMVAVLGGSALLLFQLLGKPSGPTPTPTSLVITSPTAPISTPIPPAAQPSTPTRTASPVPPVISLTPTLTQTTIPASTWQQGKLAFPLRANGGGTLLHLMNMTGNQQSMELLPNNNKLLSAPQFSPDGSQLVFHYYPGSLYVMDAAQNAPLTSLHECAAGSWSPDGQRLLCNTSATSIFFIIDAGTGVLLQSIDVGFDARIPAWSPEGNEFVFVRLENRATSIYRKSLTGNTNPVLLVGESTENYAPAYSPDGKRVAYQSNQDRALSDIWIMDRDGNNRRRITFTKDGYWSRAPAWSPDGKWLAFVSNQAGSTGDDYGEIFIVSLDTGETIMLTQTGGNVYDWRVTWGE